MERAVDLGVRWARLESPLYFWNKGAGQNYARSSIQLKKSVMKYIFYNIKDLINEVVTSHGKKWLWRSFHWCLPCLKTIPASATYLCPWFSHPLGICGGIRMLPMLCLNASLTKVKGWWRCVSIHLRDFLQEPAVCQAPSVALSSERGELFRKYLPADACCSSSPPHPCFPINWLWPQSCFVWL